MNQLSASWLPPTQRTDALHAPIDESGWLPGRTDPSAEDRAGAVAAARNFYEPLFARYTVSDTRRPGAAGAAGRVPGRRHAGGAWWYLPESAGFAALMPPAARAKADAHLAAVRRDTGVPLFDCRGWVDDRELPDGFHLTQAGAAELTPKLAAAVKEWLAGTAR